MATLFGSNLLGAGRELVFQSSTARHRVEAKTTQLCALGVLPVHSVHVSAEWDLAPLGQGRDSKTHIRCPEFAPTAIVIIVVIIIIVVIVIVIVVTIIIILKQGPTELRLTLNSQRNWE